MKNKIIIPAVLFAFLLIALGCSFFERAEKPINETTNGNSAANKSLTDTAIETAVGGEKIGVSECDDLLEHLTQISESPDDTYVAKATRQFVLSKIRENVKRSIEENKNDKAEMAKDCRQYRTQLDKYKAEETANKQ